MFGSVRGKSMIVEWWRSTACGLSAVFLAPGIAMPLFAQSTDPEDADSVAGVTEIIVTARKREESLQDVPLSIVTLSADQLQGRGLAQRLRYRQLHGGLPHPAADRPRCRSADDSWHERTGESR